MYSISCLLTSPESEDPIPIGKRGRGREKGKREEKNLREVIEIIRID